MSLPLLLKHLKPAPVKVFQRQKQEGHKGAEWSSSVWGCSYGMALSFVRGCGGCFAGMGSLFSATPSRCARRSIRPAYLPEVPSYHPVVFLSVLLLFFVAAFSQAGLSPAE
jgi:hypothetical protein